MDYQFEMIGDVLKISLDGRMIASTLEEFRAAALIRISETPNVLFDLSRMQYIDSPGLGILVHLLQKADAAGGTVKLACLQPRPKIVFDITKVYRVFRIFDSVEAGLASFDSSERAE